MTTTFDVWLGTFCVALARSSSLRARRRTTRAPDLELAGTELPRSFKGTRVVLRRALTEAARDAD